MNMGLGLYQEQTMKLVMTPELRQAISILQFSAPDLLQYLQEQALENPLLDLQEVSAASEPSVRERTTIEPDWKEVVANRATGDFSLAKKESDYNPVDFLHHSEKTLYQHLLEQLGYVKSFTSLQREVAMYLIGNINDHGFLEVSLEEAAERFGVPLAEVENVLTVIQYFDPAGVAARDLAECLLLQLRHAGLDDEQLVRMITHHLDDLAHHRYSRIAEQLDLSLPEVQERADLIRSLHPRPGAAFYNGDVRFIIPDVTVEKVQGDFLVFVNDVALPRLSINSYYEKVLSERQDSEARQFIQEKLNAAMWLARSLEQRRLTLLRVTQAIVDMQRDFFSFGPDYLKPMTQKEIAERVGLHESTVSRATNQKYVQTPWGIFELKFFFTSGLQTASGEAASSESVKRRLKALIEGEDRRKPLSDQKLADLLMKEGIEISRRTVAKYREEMRIASSAKRKRY